MAAPPALRKLRRVSSFLRSSTVVSISLIINAQLAIGWRDLLWTLRREKPTLEVNVGYVIAKLAWSVQ
jgi:hypothetical protein